MGTYIVLSKLNTAGVKTLRSNPGRLAEVSKEIEALDGKVIEQWATLGKFDLCSIVSAPDNAAFMSVAADAVLLDRYE